MAPTVIDVTIQGGTNITIRVTPIPGCTSVQIIIRDAGGNVVVNDTKDINNQPYVYTLPAGTYTVQVNYCSGTASQSVSVAID